VTNADDLHWPIEKCSEKTTKFEVVTNSYQIHSGDCESWREMAEGIFHSLEALTGERDVQPSTERWSAPATHLFRGAIELARANNRETKRAKFDIDKQR
jgi:hypothetical protein